MPKKMKIYFKWVGWRRPLLHLYHMFEGWQFVFGPFALVYEEPEPPPITVHYWKAIAFHGGGTVTTPKPMNESDALAWVSTFGNVAYVDRECGFIFYRKE